MHRRTRRGVREGAPPGLKNFGQTLFSGQAQVAQKSRMVQNISVPRKISGHTLFFRASASCSISLNVKSIFSTAKNFRASANCSKILNVKSRLYSIQPKILGQTLLFGQEQVAQKSWMINNIHSIQWKISGQLFFRANAELLKNLEW